MTSRLERVGWAVVFALLVSLSVPWFLWGTDDVAAGLPLWLWWHVAWLVLATVTFAVFADRAWGLWITDGDARTGVSK